jgi:peptidoglycan/LPS O-acetylase OafA/YrhL
LLAVTQMSITDSSRLAFVDTLRLFAASLVVFQHLAERYPASSTQSLVGLGPGVMGVVLFFLISGYVIPFSVRGGLDLRSFMIRRLCRIYPLFLVAIALVTIGGSTGLLRQWSFVRDLGGLSWATNLLLVQDFFGVPAILGVSWTLIVELIWYGLFALAILRFGERAASVLAKLMPAGLVVLALISLVIDSRIPLGRPAMIYAAVLGYQCYQYHLGKISGSAMAVGIAVFFGVTWFTNIVAFGVFAHPHITLMQALGPWTVAPLLFFVVLIPRQVRTLALFNKGVLPKIGAISYSIYLLHPIANAAAEQYGSVGAQIILALAFTLLLSFLGYRFIELPGIALGRRLSRQRSWLVPREVRS